MWTAPRCRDGINALMRRPAVFFQAVIPVEVWVDYNQGMGPGVTNKKRKTGARQGL
jgi:hypothetical protein